MGRMYLGLLVVAAIFFAHAGATMEKTSREDTAATPPVSPAPPAHKPLSFAWASDLHLDNYYGTDKAAKDVSKKCTEAGIPDIGSFGCDSPKKLIQTFLDDLDTQGTEGTETHLVISGDMLPHDYNLDAQGTAKTAIPYLDGLLSTILYGSNTDPNREKNNNPRKVHFVGTAMGNNDAVPSYYADFDDTEQKYFNDLADVMVKHKVMNEEEAKTYRKGGYYSRDIVATAAPTKVRFLSMNTNLFSVKRGRDTPAFNQTPAQYPDPCGQFGWLEAELKKARESNDTVIYLLGHIPPGMDANKCRRKKTFKYSFWRSAYEQKLGEIVNKYSDVIVGQLYAHTHHFAIRQYEGWSAPMIINTGISPVYFQNPSYFMVETDPKASHRIASLRQRCYNLTSQRDPLKEGETVVPSVWSNNPNGPLQIDNTNPPLSVANSLSSWTQDWPKFWQYNNGGRVSKTKPEEMAFERCAIMRHTPEGLSSCVNILMNNDAADTPTDAPTGAAAVKQFAKSDLGKGVGIGIGASVGTVVVALVIRRLLCREKSHTALDHDLV